jgi:hypothetical protein
MYNLKIFLHGLEIDVRKNSIIILYRGTTPLKIYFKFLKGNNPKSKKKGGEKRWIIKELREYFNV